VPTSLMHLSLNSNLATPSAPASTLPRSPTWRGLILKEIKRLNGVGKCPGIDVEELTSGPPWVSENGLKWGPAEDASVGGVAELVDVEAVLALK